MSFQAVSGKVERIMGTGKQKGANFERTICKELSKWLSNGERTDLFWRSAMSGGRATITLAKSQSGDISAITARGEKFTNIFNVECKYYRDLQIANFILNRHRSKNPKLVTFWNQCYEDAKKNGKLPLLIVKQNHYPIFICSTDDVIQSLLIWRKATLFFDLGFALLPFDEFLKIKSSFFMKRIEYLKRHIWTRGWNK